ncbi:MAG: gliding motility protein GldL [Bacteroidales bacterium]
MAKKSGFFHSKAWQNISGVIYGVGAAFVIIGALFKLQHLEGAGTMLAIGLITEAVIFILSIFEPHIEQPDWTRVFPMLSGEYDESGNNAVNFSLSGAVATPPTATAAAGSVHSVFDEAGITSESLEKLRVSFERLHSISNSLGDISQATVATDMYVNKLNSASDTMDVFSQINKKAVQSIDSAMGKLVSSYDNTTLEITSSGKAFTTQLNDANNRLNTTYVGMIDELNKEINTVSSNTGKYNKGMATLADNIGELNASIGTQLKSTVEQLSMASNFSEQLAEMNEMIASSIDEVRKYKEQSAKLNQNMEELNKFYGKMLSAIKA